MTAAQEAASAAGLWPILAASFREQAGSYVLLEVLRARRRNRVRAGDEKSVRLERVSAK